MEGDPLQNAIHPLAELCQVKITADQNKVNSGTDLTFETYFQLVYNAAINYDAQFQYKKGSSQAVFAHDLSAYNDQGNIMYEDGYDIDTAPGVVLAHIASRDAAKVRIPGPKWYELSPDTRDIWRSLPESDKAIILGVTNAPIINTPRQSNHPIPTRTMPPTRSPGDHSRLSSFAHDVVDTSPELDAIPVHPTGVTDTFDPSSTTLLANVTQQRRKWSQPKGSELPPSDIRKVLSDTHRRDPDDAHSSIQALNKVTINGTMYCAIHMAITYIISSACHHPS